MQRPQTTRDTRRFIRHTADVPIEVSTVAGQPPHRHTGVNVSIGGLSFLSDEDLDVGTLVDIRIDSVQPPFSARARVVWARREGDACHVGVQFLDDNDAFRARMVEQVCAIEQYRKQLAEQGRTLTREDAAREWIERYGNRFPAA
ncbi:MAG: PilZ domain-containing protein [Longimicrobiales bacterium]